MTIKEKVYMYLTYYTAWKSRDIWANCNVPWKQKLGDGCWNILHNNPNEDLYPCFAIRL